MAKKTRVHFDIEGVEVSVSSPDKVYFPESGITKLEVVEYYRALAKPVLRAAGGRPLVLKRYVKGIQEEAFYQKRAPASRPAWVETVTLRFPSGRSADEVVLSNEAQLVWVVNLGCLELHAHPVIAADLEHPDELRIDLDPVPGVGWDEVRAVGLETRAVLEELGLVGWPKTSGSRGLHIYVRIHPRWGFDEVRRSAQAIARTVEQRAPGRATARWWKEDREGVFLDYNQNAKDRTMAAAYSIRPTPEATVSAPLTWVELETAHPRDFTLRSMLSRLNAVGDVHADMGQGAGDLGPVLALADSLGEEEPRAKAAAKPLLIIGQAKKKADALAGLERWQARHPEVMAHVSAKDVLVDRMRGRHSLWFRVRVNLELVPESLRPVQGPLDPDYDPSVEWRQRREESDSE